MRCERVKVFKKVRDKYLLVELISLYKFDHLLQNLNHNLDSNFTPIIILILYIDSSCFFIYLSSAQLPQNCDT